MAFLQDDPLVQTAGRVAKVFGLDPVAVLDDGGDSFLYYLRIAAANVVQDDERKANEASKVKGGRRPRRR